MKKKFKNIKEFIKFDQGFTLIELTIVIALLATMLMLVGPTISRYLTKARDNFSIITGVITKTFDDSFLYGRTNFLIVHLYDSMQQGETEMGDEIFKRNNGITVANIKDGKIVETKINMLKHRAFDEDFRIEKVILDTGQVFTDGYAFIPFYPKGYAKNAIIHILVNNSDQYSIRIFKHIKEPDVIQDAYISFED